jgi:hypothetical protein
MKALAVLPTRVLSQLLLTAFVAFAPFYGIKAADNIWTRGAGNLNWNVAGNWDQGGVPQAVPFEEEAIIENGDIVFLATSTLDPAGIILGRTAATSGGFEVRAGGSINVIDSSGTPNGTVSVGVNGTGSLAVQPGGSLTAQFLNVNGQSSLTVGGVGSPAILDVASSVNLNGTTRITGAGHTVEVGSVTFGGSGTLFADIRSASHSAVRSSGAVTLDGNFVLEFGGGFTPTVGTIWNIVDAGGIAGTFANVDLSAAPALGPGQVFRLARASGGTNGELLQLQYRNVLTLNVDWDTNTVSISSPSGQVIGIDGYSVLSASGGLNPLLWNSLQDQSLAGWAEATPTANALNELNFNLGGSLGIGGTPRGLGTPFDPVFGALGQSPEDLTFEYTTSSGEIIEGLVTYSGNRVVNNMLLTVDPATGEARLKNSSPTSLTFDGYSVLSESGSLLPLNGDWLSLDDQGLNGNFWQEANATNEMLSELLTSGFLTLDPEESVSLGQLFDVGGARDLVLEFTLQGEQGGRVGTVLYEAFATENADFDGDGDIDGRDFLRWQRGVGTGTTLAQGDANGDHVVNGLDLAIWRDQYGTSPLSAVSSVPEPGSFGLAVFAALAFSTIGRRRGRKD